MSLQFSNTKGLECELNIRNNVKIKLTHYHTYYDFIQKHLIQFAP